MINRHTIDYEPFWPETAVIWGAGASVNLGLPATDEIGNIISILAGVDPDKGGYVNSKLDARIQKAFAGKVIDPVLRKAFEDLLLLLCDGNGVTDDANLISQHRQYVHNLAQKITKENGLTRNESVRVEHWLFFLHADYDWVGLRSIVQYIARKWDNKKHRRGDISYRDLITTIDQLYESDLAIPTEELFFNNSEKRPDDIYLIDKNRLIGTKKCLSHLSASIIRILAQEKPGYFSKEKILPYWTMARTLAKLMVDEAEFFYKRGMRANDRRFYYFSYAFISFNWDPVMLWLIFHAHKEINDARRKLGNSILRLFNDSGDGIGIRTMKDEYDADDDLLSFMMNESTCKSINEPKYQGGEKSRLVRIGKMLFPHAGLSWRICPRCGKLFTDFGNLDDLYSTVALGSDLLPEINKAWKNRTKKEDEYCKNGEHGVIQCIFCGSITYPYNSPLILQSLIKPDRHYVMEGIFREMGLVVGNARHLVFAGYSFPIDDYLYRCFFQSAWAGKRSGNRKPFCSLINFDANYLRLIGNKAWIKEREIISYLDSNTANPEVQQTVREALQLFDIKNIRVSLLGIPNIVTNHPEMDQRNALIDLLYPKRCFPQGFPVRRD